MSSLRDKTISGLFWSSVQKIGSRGISFVGVILLARILTPKDFGLIGMLMIFIQLSQALIDAGFNLALIQKKDADEEDYSSVFFINLVVSCLLYAIFYLTAPLIAIFYGQSELISLTRILSLIFIINAFSYVQEARLTKDIRFKTLMIIHIPSSIIGQVTGIGMALFGFGVWSIVWMQLITRLAYSIQIWIYSKWVPLFTFNKKKVRSLFSFGSKLLISKIIGVLYNNVYLVIIGKFYPVSSVGYYQNASNLIATPSNTITSILNKVTFPTFSSIQDDNRRLKSGYKRIMQQAFFWVCPMYILAGVLATPLFQFVFTAKWLPAVPYFQILCVVGILNPINTYNLNIVNVKGRSDIFLKLQIIRRVITIAAIIAVFPFGIVALLIVQTISEVFTFFLFSYFAGPFIQYHISEQLKDLVPILLVSLGVGSVVFVINQFMGDFAEIIQLVIGFGIGGGIYYLLAGYFNLLPFVEIKSLFREKISKKVLPIHGRNNL